MQAQDISGLWQSNINAPRMYIDLDAKADTCVSALLNVPIQGIKDFNDDHCVMQGDSLMISYSFMNITAKLRLCTTDRDTLKGTWQQGAKPNKIQFHKVEQIEKVQRPQTPEGPFSYTSDTIYFDNPEDSVSLHGILTIPNTSEKEYPAVVLVSGSGPSDWDQNILDHKSFWVIADHLASQGIAVLRYHDRGVASSKGNHAQATSLDLARDAVYAVEYLRSRPEINPDKVGIIGHSEGGMIAPMSYSMNPKIGFIISMAGPGEDITSLMKKQNMLAYDAANMPEKQYHMIERFYSDAIELLAKDVATEDLYQPMQDLCNKVYQDVELQYFPSTTQTKELMYMQLMQVRFLTWYSYFFKIKPREYWAQVQCPVLAINGSEDIQVTAVDNIRAIKNALDQSTNSQVTTHIFEGLNHLFQRCSTCQVSEYGTLTMTIEPEVLELMSDWIMNLYK